MESPDTLNDNYTDNTDETIINQEYSIKESEESKPLVSEYDEIENYKVNYIVSDIFTEKINQLKIDCRGYRSVRKDGNCFYRAFSYKYFELYHKNPNSEWSKAVKNVAEKSLDALVSADFDKDNSEDFYQFFIEGFDKKKFEEVSFKDDYSSNAIVVYLRLVCSAELKVNHEAYDLFIEEESMDKFRAKQVDPFGRDADNVQIIALVNALKVCVNIAYLDSSDNKVNWIKFGEEYQEDPNDPVINLLFTPGHYDILYRNDE